MRRALPAVLVLLCLTAGCNAVLGGGPDPGTNGFDETVTPAPVERFPPGVTEDTVTNASALLAAHERLLADRSVTILANTTTRSQNGGVLANVTRRLELGTDHVHEFSEAITRFGDSRSLTGETWANETVGYSRVESGNVTRYGRLRPREIHPRTRLSPALPLFADQLTAENVTVERLGDGLLRITAADLVPTDRRYANASLSIVVTDRGLVREYRYAVDQPCRPNDCRMVTTIRVTEVGETTVEKPAWIGAAGENATTSAR